jgi:hypothetical protein
MHSLGSGPRFSKIGEPNLGLGSGFTKFPEKLDQTRPHAHYSGRHSNTSHVWGSEFCTPGQAAEILEGKWGKDPISEVFSFWALVSIFGVQF